MLATQPRTHMHLVHTSLLLPVAPSYFGCPLPWPRAQEVGNLVLIPGRVSSRDLVGASLPHGLWQGPRLPSPCSRTLFRIRLHCVHDQNSLPSPGQVLGAGEAAAGRCTSCYPRCQGCLSPWVLVRAGREGLTCRVGEASHPSAFVCPLLRVGGTQADTTPSPPG